MKNFRFTLTVLQTLRERKEHEAMERYAQSLLARLRAVERLEASESDLSQARAEWRQRARDGCTAGELLQFQACCATREERRDDCAAAVGESEIALNRALLALVGARQEREAVDKCYTAQRRDYDRASSRAEQRELDDMSNRRLVPALAWRATASF